MVTRKSFVFAVSLIACTWLTRPSPAQSSEPPAPAAEQAPAAAPAPADRPRGPVVTEKKPEEQANLAPNSVYAEGLGAGMAYSVNYERLVIDQLGVRVGFSYMSYGASVTSTAGTASSHVTYLTFPITASYVGVRSGKHALELGGGATLVSTSGSATALGVGASGSGMTAFGTAFVGYRIHPVAKAGFQFRIGAMGLVGKGFSLSNPDPNAIGFLPWGYLSLGASF